MELAPAFTFMINTDRQAGMFPAGQPVDMGYLKTVAVRYGSKQDGFEEQANRGIEFLLRGRVPGRDISMKGAATCLRGTGGRCPPRARCGNARPVPS